MIGNIKDIIVGNIKKFKLFIIMFVVIFALGFSINITMRNNYKQQQKSLFTNKVSVIVYNIKNNNIEHAKKLLLSINESVLEKHSKHLITYLKHIVKIQENTNYVMTSIEYDDSSIFGTILQNKQFINLAKQKKYHDIIKYYLKPSMQASQEKIPLICYLISIQKVYNHNDSLFAFDKKYHSLDQESLHWVKNVLS